MNCTSNIVLLHVTYLKLQVLRYVRAIRKGLIKPDEKDKPKEEPRFYALWDDPSTAERQGLAYIPAPKPKLPGMHAIHSQI